MEGKDKRACSNMHECPCLKIDCTNHKICCECVANHKLAGNLPVCLRQSKYS
jgi:hypothetical protein